MERIVGRSSEGFVLDELSGLEIVGERESCLWETLAVSLPVSVQFHWEYS